jgi:DNA repair protein SbcC/Rad50
MIVRKARLRPFGPVVDRELSFSPGLNVVLGPNEAGKSTLFQAIRMCLLVTTKLTKPGLEKYVAPYLPLAGGDFIRVDMECAGPEGEWSLSRRWGSSPGSRLAVGAAAFSEEGAVIDRLARLLPATPGAVHSILMTRQSELAGTLTSLRDEKAGGALTDLADLLRKTVLDTGGVSVDRFLALLKQRIAGAFSHWDEAARGPEKGRGMERPWQREVGTVLEAWYAWQRVRAAAQAARDAEAGIDAVNAKLRQNGERLRAREGFVSAHAEAARDARDRRALEAERAAGAGEARTLAEAAAEWARKEPAAAELERSIAEADAARPGLEKEKEAARRAEDARGLREKSLRVQARIRQLDEARGKKAAAKAVERKDVDALRRACGEAERLEAGMSALSVTIAGRREVELVVQEDFGPESRRKLAPGQTAGFSGAARVRIVHPDMEIEARSGDAGAATAAGRLAEARRTRDDLLASLGVADPDAADLALRAYESLAAEETIAARSLADELGAETVEAFTARIAALGPEERTRPLATVTEELTKLDMRRDERVRELEAARRRLGELRDAHGTVEAIMEKLAAARLREKAAAEKLASSAPLPEGFTDAAAFLREHEAAQQDLAGLREERIRLEGEKERLQGALPDQSAEELAVQERDAEEACRAALRRGEALRRVDAAAAALLGGADAVFDGLRGPLERSLALMTGGRHGRVRLEGALPTAVIDDPDIAVPWDLLSAGTKDSLALALRLAMAERFISGSDGFLMMDDPLVDMDPERQAAAASALKAFAEGRQLILLTCHPTTARLVGGTLVEM